MQTRKHIDSPIKRANLSPNWLAHCKQLRAARARASTSTSKSKRKSKRKSKSKSKSRSKSRSKSKKKSKSTSRSIACAGQPCMPCCGVVVSKPVVFLYDPQGLLFTPSGFVICYVLHMLYFPDVFRRVDETPSPLRLLQLFDPC